MGPLLVSFDYNAIMLMKVMVVSLFYQVNSYPIVKGFTAIGTGGELVMILCKLWLLLNCNSRTNLWVSRF